MNVFFIIGGIGIVIGSICWILIHSKNKVISNLYGYFFGCMIVSLFIGVVGVLSGIGEEAIEYRLTSSSYYYDMLEKKTYIEEQMNKHKKEIEAIQSGKIDGVKFKNKNEIITLSNTIEKYNNIILEHRRYAEDPSMKEKCNENIVKLSTFEEIF